MTHFQKVCKKTYNHPWAEPSRGPRPVSRPVKPSILLHTKFLVPRPGADLLPRPRLIQFLESNADKRLLLLSAPAGYGKTTLLADFLATVSRPFAWYQLDALDSDPTVFLTYLIESLRRMSHAPESVRRALGQTARSLLDSADTSVSPQRVLTVLLNELAEQMEAQWLVVLEDYHYIASPVVHQLIDVLLEAAPPGLQVIVSTRADPPLALARLRARGQLAELRAPALRFREEELDQWMESSFPGLSRESLSVLNRKAEGWAAALQIVRSSLSGRDQQELDELISGFNGTQPFVFDYLADEVFRRLPEETRAFLLRISVLEHMDAAACNAVAGVQEAQSLLEDLEKQNLFVSSLDPQRRWYCFHYLFREFLLSRLQRDHADWATDLQRNAARHYETQGELEAALTHYLSAQEYEAAARVVSTFAADYVERGRVEALHRYLSALPGDVMKRNPELMLQHGNAHWRLGQPGAAIAAYEDARAAFASINNLSGVCRALTRLAEVNRAQGNYRHAEQLATEALSFAPPADHAARADALMAEAKSAGFLTGMDQGRALAEQAVEEARLAEGSLSPLARATFLQSLGQICWWHGDPQAAVRYCQEALQLAPEELSPTAAQAYISLTSPYLYWHELDKALHYAERGLEIAQTLHLKELLPSAYTVLGNVLTRLGEIARAEGCLRQAMEIGQQSGLASYEQLMATGYLAYNLCGQGRSEEARQLAEGALWSYTGSGEPYEAFVCRSVLADVALESRELDKAETFYTELVEVGERRQFRIPLAMVYFGLAYVHLETQRPASGLQYARKALRLIESSGAFQLFLDQGNRGRVVSEALIQAGERSPFLERVLENLPERQGLEAIAEKHSITVECLGGFRVWVNGEEVSQERWVSAKARDLLAYLITTRGERIHAERVFEAIWGDKTQTRRAAFHTALSRLRNALRSGDDSPRVVLVEVGEYWLDAARFKIDVDEFDSALANARAARSAAVAAEWYEQAIRLYRGDYLPNQYYEWVFAERRRLAQAHINALRTLTDFYSDHQQYRRALELNQCALNADPLQEDLHCQAMRLQAALGNRAGLMQQYQEMKRILAAELDVEPLAASHALYQRLLAGLGS